MTNHVKINKVEYAMILMQRERHWLNRKWYPIEVWPDNLDAVKQRIRDLEHDPIYMMRDPTPGAEYTAPLRNLEFKVERVVKRG